MPSQGRLLPWERQEDKRMTGYSREEDEFPNEADAMEAYQEKRDEREAAKC